PDIMTLAKGVGGGLAVGVMCATPRVGQYFNWQRYGMAVHATTLGGNCLSMAVAARVMEVIRRDDLAQHAARLGDETIERLRRFQERCPLIKQVRGKGLFVGVELDASAPGAWFKNANEVVARCMERGVLINAAQGTVLRLAPALVIQSDQLHQGLQVVEEVIQGP
ncbi:MAG TPA: aminotransferase class III-fold pyridoxal phosphate-dependent enzyme, partial [Phycisphaeraceae bacterium]